MAERPIRVRKPFRAPFPCSALPGRCGVHRDGLRSGTAGRHPGQGSVLRYDCASCGRRGVDQTPRSRSRVHGRGVERSAGGSRRPGRRPRCRPGIRRPPHGAEGGGRRYGGRQRHSTEGRRSCSWTTAQRPWRDPWTSTPRSAARSTPRSPEQAPAAPHEKAMTRDKTPHITISDRDGLPYSKGLMASQVMVTGLSVYRSYEVAETIEIRLLDAGRSSVASSEVSALALDRDRGARGGSIRDELRPVAGRGAARRAARDPDRGRDRRRQVHDRDPPRAPPRDRAGRRDRRVDPRGDAVDALGRTDAHAARLLVPDRHGRPGAHAALRRARRRVPRADGGRLGGDRGADQASGRPTGRAS